MKIHFIAIGGSAMHNLAIALKLNGNEITGSDDEIFEPSKSRLKQYGLLPAKEGWFPGELNSDIDAVILGMHARADNPELLAAQQMGLKIFSYPEFLYFHSQHKKRIVIGGSHGKTTITAMIMHVLKELEYDFDYLVGSKLKNFDVMVRLSKNAPIMIFEGDEYLSSPIDRRPKFHWYRPHIALVSGIAWDHINVFPTFDNYLEQFGIFIDLMEKGGTLIYFNDDINLKSLAAGRRQDIKIIPYTGHDSTIKEERLFLKTGNSEIPLNIFGSHNLMNIEGARLVCRVLGIENDRFYKSIESFDGTSNRLELVDHNENGYFFKDFAHAPSKVQATINAIKNQFPAYKLIACLELHTFSSLNQVFLDQYSGTFSKADAGVVYYNLHALSLKKLPLLNKTKVKAAFKFDNLAVFNDSEKLFDYLQMIKDKKVIYLMMSSGNFDGIDFKELAAKCLRDNVK